MGFPISIDGVGGPYAVSRPLVFFGIIEACFHQGRRTF